MTALDREDYSSYTPRRRRRGAGGGRRWKAVIEVRRIREKKEAKGVGLGTMREYENKIEYREKRLESVSVERDLEQDRDRKTK